MVYSNTTDKNGILQIVEFKTDLGDAYITGDATRLKQFTSLVNNENHKVWHTIFMSNGNWSYDDGNYTNLPQATTDLVSGTSKYAIPSTALTVKGINCLDAAGNWYALSPITDKLIGNKVDEFLDEPSQPMYYRLINGTAEVYTASNYNATAGIKVLFDRDSVDFASSGTGWEAKTPGFASPYHEILVLGTSIEWLKIKQPQSPTLPQLQADYLKMEKAIKDFYGKRFKDFTPRIGRAYQSYK
jgi:hypothetical protein